MPQIRQSAGVFVPRLARVENADATADVGGLQVQDERGQRPQVQASEIRIDLRAAIFSRRSPTPDYEPAAWGSVRLLILAHIWCDAKFLAFCLLMEYQEHEHNRRRYKKDRNKQQSPRLSELLHDC